MKIIVGLGNPGKDYAKTRHNIGWMLLDVLTETLKATTFRKQSAFQAEIAEAHVESEKILLVKPTTYMNRSGEAVSALLSYYHLHTNDFLVVQDEMDFPLGKMAFSASGGAAGHNGIGSIHTALGTKELNRLRLGIDRPQGQIKSEDYVLQTFSAEEQKVLRETLTRASKATMDWISLGLTRTMNSWNGVEYGVEPRTNRPPRLSADSADRE